MNIEIVQWVILLCVGFYSVLYWIFAAKAIRELQQDIVEIKDQLSYLKNRYDDLYALHNSVEDRLNTYWYGFVPLEKKVKKMWRKLK